MELPSEFVEAFDPFVIAENGKHKSLPDILYDENWKRKGYIKEK